MLRTVQNTYYAHHALRIQNVSLCYNHRFTSSTILYRSQKQPGKFFGVSSHEKRKQAQQLFESHEGERQPSKVGAKTTITGVGVEGRPSTSPGVEVALLSTPGSAMRSEEVKPSRNETPQVLFYFTLLADPLLNHPLCRVGLLYKCQRRLVSESCHLRTRYGALLVRFACQKKKE